MFLRPFDTVPLWLERLAVLALVNVTLLSCAAMAGMLTIDPIALALTMLILKITAVVLSFSRRYMRADPRRVRFAVATAGFSAAMIVLAFSRDLVSFALAWIASGQLLIHLVGHSNGCGEAEQAAQRCRTSFLVGDLALVCALLLLGMSAHSLHLPAVLAAISDLPPTTSLLAAALLATAAAVRSALPPFSGWLLGSMSAPTPVSALMHGGFVNGGGFLLIRFSGVLEAAPAVQGALVVLGTLATVYGGAVMLVRPDVKGALAGSTVSQMGFMLLTCGLGAFAAALWHLIAHGLFKAWLFLGSGSAVGMTTGAQAPTRRPVHALLISLTTLGMMVAAAGAGWLGTTLLPEALAVATALSAVALVYRWQAWPALAAAGGALLLSLAAGRGIADLLPQERLFFGTSIQAGVLLALLSGWFAQRLMASRGLPAAAYVRLVNSGALHAR